ncbi:uncharacterized protein LOC132564605 [Ylistrum balloti]|uniref:uncharacterized protein LOC132564605 n=1 Tax=Ylistrum balloti TaxID=509963 RepID=UPI0029057FE1|nr:uncharacterized protein LOC132564605 [Ylistrum balloti]
MEKIVCILMVVCLVEIQPLLINNDAFATIGSDEDNLESAASRTKRQADDYSRIQILMVVDFAVYSWFYKLTNLPDATRQERDRATEQNITRYYAFVFNRTNERYEGIEDSDVKIKLEFGGLIIAKNATAAYWTEGRREEPVEGSLRDMVDASEVLEDFHGWVNDTILPPFDHIVLFTGYNLTYGGTAYYKGLSFPDSICTFSPISVVEDTYDTRTVGFFGQEIGRSLGARLDLDGNFCLSTNLNMMTPRFRFPPDEARARNLWEFSPCSISYFKEFIGELETNCLQDSYGNQYPENLDEYLQELPGDTYGADQQCRLTNGQNSYVCREFIMDYSTICRGMPCFVPETGSCALLLPADGTICGNNSKCHRGVCEEDLTAGTAVGNCITLFFPRGNCVFGDQPVLPFGRTCGEIDLEPYSCYQQSLERACCAKCNSFRTKITDCEFGDKIGTCREENCDTEQETCCALCQGQVEETTTELYTTTTEETTTSTTTTEATTTTTTTTLKPSTTTTPTTTPTTTTSTTTSPARQLPDCNTFFRLLDNYSLSSFQDLSSWTWLDRMYCFLRSGGNYFRMMMYSGSYPRRRRRWRVYRRRRYGYRRRAVPPGKCDCENLTKKIDNLQVEIFRQKRQMKRKVAEHRRQERYLQERYWEWRRRVQGELDTRLRIFTESLQRKERQLTDKYKRKEKILEKKYKEKEFNLKQHYNRKLKDLDRKYEDLVRKMVNRYRDREKAIIKKCKAELAKKSRQIWRMRG